MAEASPGGTASALTVRLRSFEAVRILTDEAEILVTGDGHVQATDPQDSRINLSAYTGAFRGYVTVQFNAANEYTEREKVVNDGHAAEDG